MDVTTVRRLYDEHHRRALVLPGFRREEVHPVVRYIGEAVDHSFINHSTLTPEITDDTIQREVLYFTAMGHRLEWKVYDYDTPPDLKDRLAGAGFAVGEAEALLVLDAAALLERVPQGDHDIRQITDPDALSDGLNAVNNPVFGNATDSFINQELRQQMTDAPETIAAFAAYADGKPVSLAWTTFSKRGNPFAGLYGGATLPDYRGRGFYKALVRARAAAALERDVRYLHVDASPMSRPILERVGFEYLGMTWPAELSAAG